jgi:hypothetical protein
MTVDTTASVAKGLTQAAEKQTNELTQTDVALVTPIVAKEVNKQVNALVTNITNQEPWYQSRVIIGAGVSLAAQLGSLAGAQLELTPSDQEVWIDTITQLISLAGVVFALWGRLTVKPPLGQ